MTAACRAAILLWALPATAALAATPPSPAPAPAAAAPAAIAAPAAPAAAPAPALPASPASRAFAFDYTVRVAALPQGADRLRLWIPVPVPDDQQEITALTIASPVPYALHEEAEYHDRSAYLELDRNISFPVEIAMRFEAVRREHRVPLAAGPAGPAARPADLARALRPDRLVPLDGPIGELSRDRTAGVEGTLAKARAIYDFVLTTMRYDKTGEGWGRGDAIYACSAKKGNCTDFHALFIGMMRAAGIPARFEIGFPLPRDRESGTISGYHCWAQFWVDGLGWVPVDASEAWKDPARRDYFFGAHDANRVLFTRGRDVRLDPPQQGEPLNYFVYPYAEVDGRAWSGVQASFSFSDRPAASVPAGNAPIGR